MFAKFAAALALAAIAFLLSPFVAFAQENSTTVNLDPVIAEFVPYVLAVLGAVITAAVAWAAKKFSDLTGISIEARHREALQSALMNGARAAVAKATPSGVTVDVGNAAVKQGVDFVLASVPDAVAYFGLSPSDVEAHLTPKLVELVGSEK